MDSSEIPVALARGSLIIEWVAVVDACDRVGSSKYHIEDLSEELRRVGLCYFGGNRRVVLARKSGYIESVESQS